MDDRQRDLDRRIRRAQRQMFLKALWDSKIVIVGGLALFGVMIGGMAFTAMPDRLEATLLGTPLNDAGVTTTRKGAQFRHEAIRLENGLTIQLDLPGADPIRHDVPMKIEIHRRDLGPLHQVTYRFAGYADETPKS